MKKVVLITGSSRGIGSAIAKLFSEKGYIAIINYYSSEDAANDLLKDIQNSGGEAYIYKADIADKKEAEALVHFAAGITGKIDVLVNNAGIDEMGIFQELPLEAEKRLFDVNLFGTLYVSRFTLPYMINEKSGNIINISSIWGQIGASYEVQYSTSKAAIIGFTKALAKEVAPSGIRANCVAPGVIDTEMNNNVSKDDLDSFVSDVPIGRMGTVKEVADCVYFLCNASYVTGQVIGVDGGLI